MKRDSSHNTSAAGDDRKVSLARRRLFATLAAGGVLTSRALPEQWAKPVVDAVLLPAHAQTTGRGGGNGIDLAFPSANCIPIGSNTTFYDFNGGFSLPSGSDAFSNDTCSNFQGNVIFNLVYGPNYVLCG